MQKVLAAIIIGSALSGCVGQGNPTPSDSAGPPTYYSPVNRNGDLELYDVVVGRPVPQAACQVMLVQSGTRVSNLTFEVQWTPKDDSLRILRIWMVLPDGSTGNQTEGPSPLAITSKPFNATAGQEFRLLANRTASPSPSLMAGTAQIIHFHIGFVWTVSPPDTPANGRGIWDGRTHCDR